MIGKQFMKLLDTHKEFVTSNPSVSATPNAKRNSVRRTIDSDRFLLSLQVHKNVKTGDELLDFMPNIKLSKNTKKLVRRILPQKNLEKKNR